MTFFLIVPSVMVVSIILVYGIANKVGLRMHLSAPIMCALLAVLADLGAIAMSPTPDKMFFVRLGALNFFAAVVVTLVNKFLIDREIAAEAAYTEQLREIYQKRTEMVAKIRQDNIEDPEVKMTPADVLKAAENIKPGDQLFVPEVEEKISEQPEQIQVEEKISEQPEQIQVEEKISEQPEQIQAEEEISEQPEQIQAEEEKISEQPEQIQVEEKISEQPEQVQAEDEIPEQPEQKPVEEDTETLDDILDYAYSEKMNGHLWQAIEAYKKALDKYFDDEYAPFVAIDLGNIYKEQASYSKAISVYEMALSLPAVKRSAEATREFKKNLAYLKIVQSVLLRHKAISTPFGKIPQAHLQEVESEFQKIRLEDTDA